LSGVIFIDENLAFRSYVGIIIISISLFILLRQRTNLVVNNLTTITEQNNLSIYIFPFLSVIFAVSGGLLSRIVFLESNLSPFQTTEIRLLGAIIFLITIKNFRINFFLKKLDFNDQKRFLLSIFLGTNLGILLQQIVFKTLPLGVGWTLLSTSPLISLFFATKEEGQVTKGVIFFTTLLFLGLCLIIL
jgi:drug/metabolite transporter (DMT)-like permease